MVGGFKHISHMVAILLYELSIQDEMDTGPASVMPDISGIPCDDNHAGDDIKHTVDPRFANL
jgi:hypothetical protein